MQCYSCEKKSCDSLVIFFQKMPLHQVLNIRENHICRSPPQEANIYSLEAKGENMTRFRGRFTAELSVQLEPENEEGGSHQQKENQDPSLQPQEGAAPQQETRKTEHSSTPEIPLRFSRESLERVSSEQQQMLHQIFTFMSQKETHSCIAVGHKQ